VPTKAKREARIEKLQTEFSKRLLTQAEIEALVKADKPPTPPPAPPPAMPLCRGNKQRQEYAEFLQGYNWDYFLTATFRQKRIYHPQAQIEGLWYKPPSANRSYTVDAPRKEPYYALQSVWHELEQSSVARAFLVAEPHQSGDVHIHGIVSGAGPGWRPEMALPWDIWSGLFKRFGRANVELCNSQGAVSSYCSKYLLKQQSRVCDFYEVFGSKFAWHNGRDLTKA